MAKFGMDFSKLLGQLDQVTRKTYDDSNESTGYWRLTKDAAGNASATIRFLPNKDVGDFPFVRLWTHSFKNKIGDKFRWYIENSLSTIGEMDYIATVNRELYNTGLEDNIKIAKGQKRKLNYISNILVVKDHAAPENEGKVFKFKYGQKIFDKILAAAKPSPTDLDENDEPILPMNAFSPTEGANFQLKQTIVADFPNYDSSRFIGAKALCGGDEDQIQAILDQCFDLNLEVAPDKFKSAEELEKKYRWVMGETVQKTKTQASKEVDAELDALQKIASDDTPKQTEKPKKPAPVIPSATDAGSEFDNDDDFFKSLIE